MPASSGGEPFTIGQLARRTDASIKALHHFEARGLLAIAGRSESGYRLFAEDAVACVRSIKTLQAAGLSLRDIGDLARAYRPGPEFSAEMGRKLGEVLERTEAKLARLESSRRTLAELLQLSDAARTRRLTEPAIRRGA